MAIQVPVPRERNLYLARQVDQSSMNDISRAIIEINSDDEYLVKLYSLHGVSYTPAPIKLYIDSYGGMAYQCLGLLSIMEKSVVPIHTIVTGCAMSCGFLIAITGHMRYCYDKSTFLYHQISYGAIGKAQDIEEEVMEGKRVQKLIEDHTVKHTKLTKKLLSDNKVKKIDWVFDPKQSLKHGIVDEII